ncbi:MAG: 50S ribosomal protein L21 [Verrucomicrobia bacterium]|nr:50S ribosomal protein L21 [Verrucomicrobiota bacterium]
MYAVVQTGGKQYRVAAGDKLEVERLTAEPGESVVLDEVLLVNKDGQLTVGNPKVEGAQVVAEVLAQKRGEKLIVWKMKRRKGYRRKKGHRQELTVLRVKEIKA